MVQFKGTIDVHVDLQQLRKQKESLLEVQDPEDTRDASLLGLVHFLDAIQDEIAKQVGESPVFGLLD